MSDKMAGVTIQTAKDEQVSLCAICFNSFNRKESKRSDVLPSYLSANTGGLHVCSTTCRWQLQYDIGIIHGLLLFSTVHRLLEKERMFGSIIHLNTVPAQWSKISPIFNKDCKDGSESSANDSGGRCIDGVNISPVNAGNNFSVKLEDSVSDPEDFDCNVNVPKDLHYGGSIDSNGCITESEDSLPVPDTTIHQKPAKHVKKASLQRQVEASFEVKTAQVHQQAKTEHGLSDDKQVINDEINETKTMCEKSLGVQIKTGVKNGIGSARKLAPRSKRKLIETEMLSALKNTAADKTEKKRQKVSENNSGTEDTVRLEENNTKNEEEQPLQCEFCFKAFTAKRFLQRHLNRFHPKEIAISCDVCGDVCKNRKCLNVHMRKEHNLKVFEGEELFHCDQCSKSFHSRRGVSLHKEFVHSQENPVNCQLCDLTLKNDIYLKRHMKRSHSDSIICDICGAKFKSRLALSSHLSAHKGVKSYFCEVCGMGFVRKTSLRRHMQQHDDVNYSCDTCSSSYKTFGSLSLHMLQIHQRGSYFDNRLRSVEKLGYAVDRESVKRHLNQQCVTCGENLVSGACPKHPTSYALMFKCHRCELIAEHVDDLLAHLRDHKSGTSSSSVCVSFDCKVCHKVFPRKLYLNQHMKKHHPGASMTSISLSPTTLTYCCQVCGKHFQQKQYLYVHMKQHLQPGTFACHICDRKFTYKCNLKNHLTTHSEDKPFKCEVCFKLFRRKEVLNSHRLVHNPNLSPFKCHICGKGLSRKQYLRKHYQIMHPEEPEPQPSQPHPPHPQQQSV